MSVWSLVGGRTEGTVSGARRSRRSRPGRAVLAAVILLAGAACAEGAVPLGENDSGAEVWLEPGDRVEVELPSDRRTGYRWQLAEVPPMLERVSDRYWGPRRDDLDGPGSQRLTLGVVAEGNGVLRLEYVRPSEDPTEAARTIRYVVRVNGPVASGGDQ